MWFAVAVENGWFVCFFSMRFMVSVVVVVVVDVLNGPYWLLLLLLLQVIGGVVGVIIAICIDVAGFVAARGWYWGDD